MGRKSPGPVEISQTPKYHNTKVSVDGIKFDSIKEADRFRELALLERAGEIFNLHLQEEIMIQGAFTKPSGERVKSIKYLADFVYNDQDGIRVVEDVKGVKTTVYALKKRLLSYEGTQVVEI